MIRRIVLSCMMCIGISCFEESATGPDTQKFKATGTFSYAYNKETFSYAVPEGAGSCMIIGDSTKYFVSLSASDSKTNSEAEKSKIVFFGYIKGGTKGTITQGSSDSTFEMGFYDQKGNAYSASDGTITFTVFPLHAGDTLKGTIAATVNSIIKYDPKPFVAQFSLVCERLN